MDLGGWDLFSQFNDDKMFCSGIFWFFIWQQLCKIKHEKITWGNVFLSISRARWRHLNRAFNLPKAFSMVTLALDNMQPKYFSLWFFHPLGYYFIKKVIEGRQDLQLSRRVLCYVLPLKLFHILVFLPFLTFH